MKKGNGRRHSQMCDECRESLRNIMLGQYRFFLKYIQKAYLLNGSKNAAPATNRAM